MSHVRKGWDQNLRISSATSSANLWAVIMDQSTGYTRQSFKVGPSFLPKSWCLEQWDAGFYITAVAGAEEHTLRRQLCPCLSGSCCAMKLGTSRGCMCHEQACMSEVAPEARIVSI